MSLSKLGVYKTVTSVKYRFPTEYYYEFRDTSSHTKPSNTSQSVVSRKLKFKQQGVDLDTPLHKAIMKGKKINVLKVIMLDHY